MVFKIISGLNKSGKQPLINESIIPSGINFSTRQTAISKRLMQEIKTLPEYIGMLDTVVTDHFQGEVDFYGINGETLGPTKFKEAKRFWKENNVMSVFYGAGMDYFIDGSCFGWVGSINNSKNSKAKEMLNNLNINLKSIHGIDVKQMIDEEGNKPRVIDYIPASTVEIKFDEQNILGYKQQIGSKEILYNLDEIIHLKLMEFNGEVRGFSGFKALAKEIVMLWMLKDNMVAKLDNGGAPDNIISLKNANGGSRQKFKNLRVALETFSHIKQSHGNLAIDAEIDVKELGTALKDMEYRELAMFVISEFCLALGLPTSRVPFLMTGSGGTSNKGELAGDADQSYQRKVNNRRLRWEQAWNNEVFNKLGFSFKFRRDNLQDEVKEVQASTQRYAGATSLQDSLSKAGKQLKIDSLLAYLSGKKKDFDINDIEEFEMNEQLMPQMGGGFNAQNSKPKDVELGNNVTADRSKAREQSANNKGEHA